MSRQTAIVVAPGRGTYNRAELGYLARHHADKAELIRGFDAYRTAQGQPTLSDLDGAERFTASRHTRGDNASALIHACAYADFLSIDRERYDILGVTGNSMGWYIALSCAGTLAGINGLRVVNTMGTLMHEKMIGGQVIYPFVDAEWHVVPGLRDRILQTVTDINSRTDHVLDLSIDLGGMLVLAGNAAGLSAFEAEMPPVQDRFPMRLPNHAAFHTRLQAPVATLGQQRLGPDLFAQPHLPLIDGGGGIWQPKATATEALHAYTLGHQVTESYDFTRAIRTAAYEFMPDVFIVLGPGDTLGGAVAQSLILSGWRGWSDKSSFRQAQADTPRLLAMGRADQRGVVVKG